VAGALVAQADRRFPAYRLRAIHHEWPHVGKPPLWIDAGDRKLKLELHVFSRPYAHARELPSIAVKPLCPLAMRTGEDTTVTLTAAILAQLTLRSLNYFDATKWRRRFRSGQAQ
jgi:hypothetical protein